MPRTPRLDFAGARHHVMNRSSRRRAIFRDADDLSLFTHLLSELPPRFGARIHGYALMGNHYHLMLEVPRGNLSEALAWLNGELARRMNAAHGWDGPLFRGRFRNRVVMDEPYWRHLLLYNHMNPVRAGRVAHPDESGWTSHRAYAGLDAAPPWLSRDELLDLFGSGAQYREEIGGLVTGQRRLPEALSESLLWQVPDTAGSALVRVPATVSPPSAEEGLAAVAAQTGVSVERLLRPVKGRRGNAERALAAWWLMRACALGREGVGERLGMSASAVAGASHRVRVATEGPLVAWREALMAAWWGPMAESSLEELEQMRVLQEKEMVPT